MIYRIKGIAVNRPLVGEVKHSIVLRLCLSLLVSLCRWTVNLSSASLWPSPQCLIPAACLGGTGWVERAYVFPSPTQTVRRAWCCISAPRPPAPAGRLSSDVTSALGSSKIVFFEGRPC